MRELIKITRTLTDKPFGVGVVLAFPCEENLKVILDEKVAVLQTYWGDCTRDLVTKAHAAGVKVVPQVSFILCPFINNNTKLLLIQIIAYRENDVPILVFVFIDL